MADFLQEYDLANLCTFNTLINVDKCLDIAITAVRSIIDIYILMMFKKEEFYLQEVHAWYQCINSNKNWRKAVLKSFQQIG